MNDELERNGMKRVLVYFKVLLHQLNEGTKEKYEILRKLHSRDLSLGHPEYEGSNPGFGFRGLIISAW